MSSSVSFAADVQQQTAPSSAAPEQQAAQASTGATDKAKKEFIKSHAGLTTVPVKVMVMADLEALDLSNNAIEIVPKGVFSDIPKLKTCDLSNNSIKSLPEDVGMLKELESFVLHHNCLSTLPVTLYNLAGLKTLDVSYNRLTRLQREIRLMEGLQILNVSGNRLRSLPADLGWLSLKQLSLVDNVDLHIPIHVLQKGFRAVMSYLQVVGEQHHQVETHMEAFTNRLTDLRAKHNLLLPGAVEDEEAVLLRIKLAQKLGVLSCSECNLAMLPALLTADEQALAAVQVVDLSYNKLSTCPRNLLSCINNLLVLNLSFNRLEAWPAGLHMPALVVLNLSFNKLQQLPPDLGQQMPALQQLYLANNFLKELPDSLAHLELRDLFVSENDLQVVPQVLSECTSLVKLSLAACQLTGPCQELAGMSQLRFLDVSFNKLTVLSNELSNLDGLSALNLSYNALGSFPQVLSCLTCLRELNLDSTGITRFPRELGELRHLEGLQADGCELVAPYASLYAKNPLLLVALHDREALAVDLSDCKLDAVPGDLLQQTQLTSLNLGKNNIQDLPAELGKLRRLRQLVLKGNPLHQPFARLIDARGELALLALLRPEGAAGVLDLSACGFDALPSLVWDLPGRALALQELNLTNNRLRTLPEELAGLESLTRLVVDNNLLRKLPDVVFKLPSLAVLQAAGNTITHLPEGLEQLRSLQGLILSTNQLHQLPESISALTKLRALSVASNRLWQLPAGISHCSALRLLDCSHNQLGKLPQKLSQLVSLRSLKLTHNRLGWLPVDDLQHVKNLEELHVAANAFRVEGIDNLNASGQQRVQQLLAAILASGHGVPQPTQHHGHSESVGGGSISGLHAECSEGRTSTGRSSIGSIGSRSPSPLRSGSQADQPAASGGLFSALKRIGSRSSSPTRQERPQQGAAVKFSDGVEATSKGVEAAAAATSIASAAAGSSCPAAASRDEMAAAASADQKAANHRASVRFAGDPSNNTCEQPEASHSPQAVSSVLASTPSADEKAANHRASVHFAGDPSSTGKQQEASHSPEEQLQPAAADQKAANLRASVHFVGDPSSDTCEQPEPSHSPEEQLQPTAADHKAANHRASVHFAGDPSKDTCEQPEPSHSPQEQLQPTAKGTVEQQDVQAQHGHTGAHVRFIDGLVSDLEEATDAAAASLSAALALACKSTPAAEAVDSKVGVSQGTAHTAPGSEPSAAVSGSPPKGAAAAAAIPPAAAMSPAVSGSPAKAAAATAAAVRNSPPKGSAAAAAAVSGSPAKGAAAAAAAPAVNSITPAKGSAAAAAAAVSGSAAKAAAAAAAAAPAVKNSSNFKPTGAVEAKQTLAAGTADASSKGIASQAKSAASKAEAKQGAKQPAGKQPQQHVDHAAGKQAQEQTTTSPNTRKADPASAAASAATCGPAPKQQVASSLQDKSAGHAVAKAAANDGSMAAGSKTPQSSSGGSSAHDPAAPQPQKAPIQGAGRSAVAPGQLQHPGDDHRTAAGSKHSNNITAPSAMKAAASSAESNGPCIKSATGSDTGSKSISSAAGTSGMLPPGSWSLLQGSAALSARPEGWADFPIMEIPRVVKACLSARPPPSAVAGQPQQPARPQTRARFKRVMQQSANALALLEYGMSQASSQPAA